MCNVIQTCSNTYIEFRSTFLKRLGLRSPKLMGMKCLTMFVFEILLFSLTEAKTIPIYMYSSILYISFYSFYALTRGTGNHRYILLFIRRYNNKMFNAYTYGYFH